MSGPSNKQRVRVQTRKRLEQWSAALKRDAELHGRPNSFGVRELAHEYNLTVRHGYYVGNFRLADLWAFLGGLEQWGSCPTYFEGRFYV